MIRATYCRTNGTVVLVVVVVVVVVRVPGMAVVVVVVAVVVVVVVALAAGEATDSRQFVTSLLSWSSWWRLLGLPIASKHMDRIESDRIDRPF